MQLLRPGLVVGADSATPAGAVGDAVADRFGSEVSAHCSLGSRA